MTFFLAKFAEMRKQHDLQVRFSVVLGITVVIS